jgi:hypothetical protein
MGRRKRGGDHSSQKNNLTQDSERSEENGYPVPDPNKTKINSTEETINAHKNTLKEEIMELITENFMEKYQKQLTKMCTSRNFKTTKIKNSRRQRYK